MKIHLVRDSERLVWNFAKSETEMWKEPPEPLLEKIADTLFSESDRWEGTASELCERLAVDIKPNVLSLRLSINASRLFRDLRYPLSEQPTHDGRKVSLGKKPATRGQTVSKVSMFLRAARCENIVTIVTL